MSLRYVHLCSFVGKRAGPVPWTPRTRCELNRCSQRASVYVAYVWGAAALCEKHAREETGA